MEGEFDPTICLGAHTLRGGGGGGRGEVWSDNGLFGGSTPLVGLPTRFTIEREADIVQSSQNYLVTPDSLDLVQSKPLMHTAQVFVSPGALQEHIVEYNQRVFVGKGRPIAAEKDSLKFFFASIQELAIIRMICKWLLCVRRGGSRCERWWW